MMRPLPFLSLLLAVLFFSFPRIVHAFSSYSLTVSSHAPLVLTTYLLTLGVSTPLSSGDRLTFTMDEEFIWPSNLEPTDLKLTINGVEKSIGALTSTSGYSLKNSPGNEVTLTVPVGETILAGSTVEMLLGSRGNFYNAIYPKIYPYTVTLRTSSGDLVDAGSGVTLVQDTRVGLSAELPFPAGGNTKSPLSTLDAPKPSVTDPSAKPKKTTPKAAPTFEPIFPPVVDESRPVKPDRSIVDITNDQVIDRKDAEMFFEFHEMLPTPTFDFDLNGEVNTRDFSILLSQWSESAPQPPSSGGGSGAAGSVPVAVGPPLTQDHVILHGVVDDNGSDAFVIASVTTLALRDDVMTTYVLLDTGKTGVNAVDFEFFFDPNVLTFVRAITDVSVFSIWKQTPRVSTDGRIEFVAGNPTPFLGTNGVIAALEFVKKNKTAPVSFSFSKEPNIYHPEGVRAQVAEALTRFVDLETFNTSHPSATPTQEQPAVKSVPPVTLRSSTHPEEGVWYANRNIRADWMIDTEHQQGDQYLYTLTPTRMLVEESKYQITSGQSINLQAPGDGRWYLHVIRVRAGQNSTPSIFEIFVDTESPKPFLIEKGFFESFDGKKNYLLTFGTMDHTSGVVWYDVSVNGGKKSRLTQTHDVLSDLRPGYYVIEVSAQDAAGNRQIERTVLTVPFPSRVIWLVFLGGLLIALSALLAYLHKQIPHAKMSL